MIENPGLTATTECRYRRKDGDYEWVEFSGINRLQDQNIAGILINFHIITERKRSEEAFIAQMGELDTIRKIRMQTPDSYLLKILTLTI